MGVVYEASDDKKQRLAIKALEAVNEVGLHRMRHEIKALRRLRHPGLARLLDEGLHQQSVPWYAMTLHRGHTLDWYIREHHQNAHRREGESPQSIPSGIRRVLSWLGQLAQTLAWLHGEGYVHCDLKPENIIMDQGDKPVLVDFGVVARFGTRVAPRSLETSGLMAGTADYISPEQIRGGLVDARADLYALGCILYEVLTGKPPFYGLPHKKLLEMHLEGEHVPPSQLQPWVPPALDALVRDLLRKDPTERPGHANAVLACLRTLDIPDLERADLPPPRPYLYKPSLVGREKLMKALRRSVRGAVRGEGTAVLLGGESGQGKSRVALELLRYARSRRILSLTGQGEDLSTRGGMVSAPLQTFSPLLQSIADRCLEGGLEGTERLLGQHGPVLAPYAPFLRLLPGQEVLPQPPPLSPEASRRRVFRALLETLSAMVGAEPLLLVFDDLQWADELSLICIRALARWIKTSNKPWMLLGLYRSDLHEQIPEMQALIQCDALRDVQLGRLTDEEVQSILRDMLGLEDVQKDLAAFITHQARGNPLTSAELLHAVVDQHLLVRDDAGSWTLSSSASRLRTSLSGLMSTPNLVQTQLRNLDQLPSNALLLAWTAAVIGREADLDLLLEISQASEHDQALAELERRDLMERVDEHRVRFRQPRLREALYASIPAKHRNNLHGRAAITLSSLSEAGQAVDDTRLAYHWEKSGQSQLASRVYLKAARQAAAAGTLRDARRLFEHGLSLLPEDHPEALKGRKDLVEFVLLPEDDLEAAQQKLEQHTPQPASPRLELLRGRLARRNLDLSQALVELQRALENSQARGDRELERAVALELGSTLVWRGFLTRATEVLRQVLDDPALRQDANARIRATLDLSLALLRQGLHAESTNRHRLALRIARQSGERRLEGRALRRLAHLHCLQGRADLAQEMLQEAFLIATEQVDTEGMNRASLQAAARSRHEGRHNSAREELQALLQQNERSLPPSLRALAIASMGDLESDRGHLGEARGHYLQAMEMQRRTGQIYELQESQLRLARLALLQGDPQEALSLLEPILLYARTQSATPLHGQAHHTSAQALLAQGELLLAEEHLSQALDSASKSQLHDLEARSLVTWARLHRLREERPLASSKLQQARALQQELGDIYLLSLCLLEEGHQRLQREEPVQELMQDLLRIADAQAAMPNSQLGQGLAQLQRALAAHRRGEALLHGLLPADLPQHLQAPLPSPS